MPVDPWQTNWVDYYEKLTVSPNASIRVIKAAYRVLALDHHPDSGKFADVERMTRINAAFKVLADPEMRARYDQLHRVRLPRPFAPATTPVANAKPSVSWVASEPHPETAPHAHFPTRTSWGDLLPFSVLLFGMFGLLVAVITVILLQ